MKTAIEYKPLIPGLPMRDIDGELWLVQADVGACFTHYSELLGHQETYWSQAHLYWSTTALATIKKALGK